MVLWAVAGEYSRSLRLAGGCVPAKHDFVGPEDAAVPLYLVLLDFHRLLVLALHEVILPWGVRAQRLPRLRTLAHRLGRGLPRTHYLHSDLVAALAQGSLATAYRALPLDKSTSAAHSTGADLARSLLRGTAAFTKTASTLRLVGVRLREGAHWAGGLLLRVRTEQAIQVLRSGPRSRALTLGRHHALLIGKLAATPGLLTVPS